MLQARGNQEAPIDVSRNLLIWDKSWKIQQEAKASYELGTTMCEFNFHDHDTVLLTNKFIPLCFTVVDLILFPCELSPRLIGYSPIWVSFANDANL